MSRTEIWRGKIKKVAEVDEAEKFAYNYLNGVKPDYMDTFLEELRDTHGEKFLLTSKGLFENFAEELGEFEYPTIVRQISEDEFEIVAAFYNGGTYLEEVINDELERLVN